MDDEIWHVLCRDDKYYLQESEGAYDWVETKSPIYFLTVNNALLINMLIEDHIFSRQYVEQYPSDQWDGIVTSRDIALIVAMCHHVNIDDLELCRRDGKQFAMRLDEGVKEIFHFMYIDIPTKLKDIKDILGFEE
jgi:hypothetical protein